MGMEPKISLGCSIANSFNRLTRCFKREPKTESLILLQKQSFLLSPLSNLLNLSRIQLNLQENEIGDNIA